MSRSAGVVRLAIGAAIAFSLLMQSAFVNWSGRESGVVFADDQAPGRKQPARSVVASLTAENESSGEFDSVAEAREVQKRLCEICDKVIPAVVSISSRDPGSEGPTHEGTGVVIDPSGVVLTHGHHGHEVGTLLQVRFPDGKKGDADIQSVFAGRGRDFSLLKIQSTGPFPAAALRRDSHPTPGERCFHLGCPNELVVAEAPVLRLGRISGHGRFSIYANCLTNSGDSGGPLFDFEGRVIGILDTALGPYLAHPGQWASVSTILDGKTFLQLYDDSEVERLGFLDRNRKAIDTRKHIDVTTPNPFARAVQATVEVLIDDKPAILGTVVDADGLVLSKRSELLTRRGTPLGLLTCRLSTGETVPAKVVADSHEDDLVLLRLPKRGLTPAPWSEQDDARRGTMIVVAVPGRTTMETGVVGVDRAFAIPSDPGRAQLRVEAIDGHVTITGSSTNFELDRYAKFIRGSVRAGDLIEKIDGQPCLDLATYELLTTNIAATGGEFLTLTLRRDGTPLQAALPLDETHDGIAYREYAERSLRATGFKAVITHDAIVPRSQCGGPIVDWEGRVIGVNIARIHRYSTLAIPQKVVRSRVRAMLESIK